MGGDLIFDNNLCQSAWKYIYQYIKNRTKRDSGLTNTSTKIQSVIQLRPDKGKSTKKIDGVVATIITLDHTIRSGWNNGESVYYECGMFLI